MLTLREPDNLKPERINFAHRLQESTQSDWFADIATCLVLVGGGDVFFAVRRGEHDHRNRPELLIVEKRGEHLVAIHSGHVEIEQNEIGPGSSRKRVITAKKRKEFHAVAHVMGIVRNGTPFEGLERQARVARAVLSKKDLQRFAVVLPEECLGLCHGERLRLWGQQVTQPPAVARWAGGSLEVAALQGG